ncbi:AGAP000725-PA-like protein [Anopheles sinensis]|uniref:AGAP000725-PA-like protein n=1 Tax=Anopheles sinensis TaxID=74873 RepID=A0A084VVR2_ANOSI|nr:AGAP000725-PA-like protein [Anopheles sinensis]
MVVFYRLTANREKPDEPEWIELAQAKIPLLLNYSQCKLLERDYYAAIEHCTEVLKYDRDCVKALFRRGKAHAGAWNFDRARADFQRCEQLDASLHDTRFLKLFFCFPHRFVHELTPSPAC